MRYFVVNVMRRERGSRGDYEKLYLAEDARWVESLDRAKIFGSFEAAKDAIIYAIFDVNKYEFEMNWVSINYVEESFCGTRCVFDYVYLWERLKDGYRCPYCKKIVAEPYNYCPHCGKKMREGRVER